MQQINLYALLPKKVRSPLSAKIVGSSYAAFAILLILIYFTTAWKKHELLRQYNQLNSQVLTLQQQLNALTQQYPVSDALNLKNEVQKLQQQVENKSKIINLLTLHADFSTYLLGLANISVPDLWMTEITFDHTEQKIDLKGFCVHSEQVEELLSQLAQQAAFPAMQFQLQNISEITSPPSFYIATKQESSS
jgi:hypothetical protein